MADNNSGSKVGGGPPFSLIKAEVSWMSTLRGNLSYEERILRKVRGILNKLTVEKYTLLRSQLIDSGITTPSILQGVVSQIFNKALAEPMFCPLYAVLCSDLAEYLPSFPSDEPHGKEISFRRILLNMCQAAYECANMKAVETRQQIMTGASIQDLEYGYKERRRKLGNIQFICELLKQKSVPLKIIHHIMVTDLLERNDVEVDVEAVCLLLNTVGKQLVVFRKFLVLNNGYYDRLKDMLTTHPQLEIRLKFMIRDVMFWIFELTIGSTQGIKIR